jgi:hypothetical protein
MGEKLTRGVMAVSLEDYVFDKPSWKTLSSLSQRPVMGNPNLRLRQIERDLYRFDFECEFLLHHNFIVADFEKGRKRTSCKPGSFSLCIEAIFQNNQTGGKVRCRRWTDGFSIVLLNDRSVEANDAFLRAPPEEMTPLPANFVQKPRRMRTELSRKRSVSDLGSPVVTQPSLDETSLFFKVVDTNFGVVHSFRKSQITVCFEGNAEPRLYVEILPCYLANELLFRVEWISSHCVVFYFEEFGHILDNPSLLTFTFTYGGKTFLKEISIETCSNCETCRIKK